MTATQREELRRRGLACYAPRFTGSVADWCCAQLRFDEPGNRGPFTTAGREYVIEPLNDWSDVTISDCVEVFGTQSGKTGMLMAGVAWSLVHDPCGMLWVMPSIDLARSFAETRWMPMLRASPGTAELIPAGAGRHAFKKLQQSVGGSVINFVGSNSPGNLASRPARKVILDEVDKFDTGGNEADAVNLAEQRTKGQPYPQRRKTSSPTLITGLVWQEYLKGDQRRYFVPCPSCGKSVVLAWSKQYTVLPLLPELAFVRWDKEARRPNGTWDLDRVAQSARAECPHCGGHIRDGDKTRILPRGEWRPTSPGDAGFRSRHLPSLYACSPETGFGKLAIKFLRDKRSLMGLQGFINGDLAEPYERQDIGAERVEIVSEKLGQTPGAKPLLTVDCQQSAPHFWFVVREWLDGNSNALAAGSCDTWEELRAVQLEHAAEDVGVLVDSGYGAKSDAEVYRNCASYGERVDTITLPLHVGWMPAKGMPGRKRWKDNETGMYVPYYIRSIDPFMGTTEAGKLSMSLFEFSGDFFLDVLEALRAGRGGYQWAVQKAVATETYWRHLDSSIKVATINKVTGQTTMQWRKRHAHWPDHLLDCEKMQVALAMYYGLFKLEEEL